MTRLDYARLAGPALPLTKVGIIVGSDALQVCSGGAGAAVAAVPAQAGGQAGRRAGKRTWVECMCMAV